MRGTGREKGERTIVKPNGGNIDAIDQDTASRSLVDSQQTQDQRRLPGASATTDAEPLARFLWTREIRNSMPETQQESVDAQSRVQCLSELAPNQHGSASRSPPF